MSVFGVPLVRIFPHSDWIRRDKSLRIQSEWGKIQTRITPNTDTYFLHSIFQLLECNKINIFLQRSCRNLSYSKSKLYKTFDYWSRDMLKSEFLEKDLELISPPHFMCDLSREMLILLYSINWPNFIVWLSLRLQILDNICIFQLFVIQAVRS